jgi:hypothetical protein
MVTIAQAIAANIDVKRVLIMFIVISLRFWGTCPPNQARWLATGVIAGATLTPTVMKAQTTAANRAVRWLRVAVVMMSFLFRFKFPGSIRYAATTALNVPVLEKCVNSIV